MRKKLMLLGIVAIGSMMTMTGCLNIHNSDKEPNTEQIIRDAEDTETGEEDMISEGAAKAIALDDAGVSEKDVTNCKVEYSEDDGVEEYEVTFRLNGKKYDYQIRKSDGKILSKDFNDVDDNDDDSDDGKKISSTRSVRDDNDDNNDDDNVTQKSTQKTYSDDDNDDDSDDDDSDDDSDDDNDDDGDDD